MLNIPIVVIAYNRPHSLARLIRSLDKASYPQRTDLIISIDGGGNNEVINIAEGFNWKYGNKKIIRHTINLGLLKHVLSCGNLSQEYDGIIVLEDDLYASPAFYSYILQAVDFYKNYDEIAGIALYNHSFNETAQFPFHPIQDGSDIFFMQLACSWGQCWTKQQWSNFIGWYNDPENLKIWNDCYIPTNILMWSESSWKKYFTKYIIENNKYIAYPRISLSTNFGDKGEHHTKNKQFQVPLQFGDIIYKFKPISDSIAVYDAYCEILPSRLNRLIPDLKNYEYSIDLYGMKLLSNIDSEYILTTKRIIGSPIFNYGKEMIPLEQNVIEKINGNEIFLSKIKDCKDIDDYYYYRELRCSDVNELYYHYKLSPTHLQSQNCTIFNYLNRIRLFFLWQMRRLKCSIKSK